MSIERKHGNQRMSQIVCYGDTVYLAGQVAQNKPGGSIADQTKDILDTIDKYLVEAGSDKSKVLQAQIWITDMGGFDEMNKVWDAWVTEGNTPARACVEARLASPKFDVEIMVIAAR